MVIGANPEAALLAQRGLLLTELVAVSQASQQTAQAIAVGQVSEAALNLRGLNTGAAVPLDPARGRTLDIFV
jgi:hypothetical protein